MKNLPHIGTIELVSLPSEGIQSVPAKIDTGADTSAIWASQITESGDQLSFVLFDTSSPFYSGKTISTSDYQVASIKNSFGQSEFRYKVKLSIKVGERTIKATFSLANRANNRYPILIGRRTLHGKFLVDVTRKPAKREQHVLMLSTKRTDVTQAFADNVQSSGELLQVTYAAYEDLNFVLSEKGVSITLFESGKDLASFDLVHFKTTARFQDVAAAVARYLERRNVPFLDEAIKHFPGTSKLYQYYLLDGSGLAVPHSVFQLPNRLVKSYKYLEKELGLPFILKDIHGNKGEHNYLVSDEKSFKTALKKAATEEVQCIAQAFIPNDGDYRVLVFGTKISMIIERKRLSDKTHLNNTSKGAEASIVPTSALPPIVQKACLEAAKLVERQVAGVDIVRDKDTGLWYCLEVNDGPQLATGSFRTEKHAAFANYLERKLS